MLKDERIAFVGAGMMGEAMIRGVLAKQLIAPAQIVASGPRAARGQELRNRYEIEVTTDNLAAVQGASVVVLSVKPQAMPQIYPTLKGQVPGEALVLSIVAGARLADRMQ